MRDNKIYFENLDALRFLAALIVVLFHSLLWLPFPNTQFWHWARIFLTVDSNGGAVGVNFFFTLSGFLITYLLIQEFNMTGKTDVKGFYIRRVLRIWPLYYFTLLIGFFVFPLLLYGTIGVRNETMYIFFLANFDVVYNGIPPSWILGVLWSVSAEEQFYLIWPLFFVMFRKRSVFPFMTTLLIIISAYCSYRNISVFNPLISMGDLAIGALAAHYCYYSRSKITEVISWLNKFQVVIIYFLGILFLYANFRLTRSFPGYDLIFDFLSSVFFVFVIVDQSFALRNFLKIGSIKFFTVWGKKAYGIYLLHMIAITIIKYLSNIIELNGIVQLLLVLIITLIVSHFSYYYLESYFLKWKERISKIRKQEAL